MAKTNAAVAGALLALLVALWLFPIVLFPSPGTNDAIWLANLELLVVLVGWIGIAVVLVVSGQRRAAVCVELGVFLIGAAAALVLGLIAFGNMSNDRYLPLLLLPVLLAAPGLVLLVIGLFIHGDRAELPRAGIYGFIAAVAVAVWILVRGSRDWLLAPYGFDIVVLILVMGAALAMWRPQRDG